MDKAPNPSPEEEVNPIFVERVVDKLQHEIGEQIRNLPGISVNEIKMIAMNRLIDLINKQLLTVKEADKIYIRFARMLHHYYGL